MSAPDYPHCRPWTDRSGRTRWRFRRSGKTVYLPGEPGAPEFEAAYQAIVAGLAAPPKRRAADVARVPRACAPRSLRAAWRAYVETAPGWRALDPATRANQTAIAEAFLREPIAPGVAQLWGDVPVADLKRRHVKMILSAMADRPFAAKHRLSVIRKMIEAALDEEWIEADPTHRLRYAPERIAGHRAWTQEERDAFERRWPPGTAPRLAYALAFWLGNRRGDVAALRWDQRGEWRDASGVAHDVFRVIQEKTGKALILPVTPMLAECLAAAPRACETVLSNAYGRPFSPKALTTRMRAWTSAAGLAQGCTFHGLRKTLGTMLAESGATTRELMEMLGHGNISHASLYSEDAEQARLAVAAAGKVVRAEFRRRVGRP